MDISIIKAQETNAVTGIHIGDPSAKPIVEFMNLRCPYCRQWFEESLPILSEAVTAGKLRRVIKLFDKEKESLQRGNVMHRFVSSTDPQATIAEITKIYQTQDEWGHLSLNEVAEYAKNTLGLFEQNHPAIAGEIVEEAKNANIQFVPTIILDGHIFDESITAEELTALINE